MVGSSPSSTVSPVICGGATGSYRVIKFVVPLIFPSFGRSLSPSTANRRLVISPTSASVMILLNGTAQPSVPEVGVFVQYRYDTPDASVDSSKTSSKMLTFVQLTGTTVTLPGSEGATVSSSYTRSQPMP